MIQATEDCRLDSCVWRDLYRDGSIADVLFFAQKNFSERTKSQFFDSAKVSKLISGHRPFGWWHNLRQIDVVVEIALRFELLENRMLD